ncbi:uncharacterized protein IAS62_001648 [Cryptococcus decagattii]|uniref:Uncharacterized protein n=1 Tax=Cryptococcus decagattii TaxID=1859122 RepID=A0ABZ2AR40_9TREE
MNKSLEGGELCLRHDIYRLSHSQGTTTEFDWGALRGCKSFSFNNASNFCYKPAVKDTPSLRDLLRLLQWTFRVWNFWFCCDEKGTQGGHLRFRGSGLLLSS